MTTTIDKAGRIVVPKKLRDRYNLQAGTLLELEPAADGIRITPLGTSAALVQERGITVHHGPSTVDLDIADYVERSRKARIDGIVAEQPNT